MIDYHQPSFYRFNEDSLKLIRFVSSKVSSAGSILDLGAGSGIIGIELANLLKPSHLVLLELQTEYFEYLQFNRDHFLNKEVTCELIESSFKDWKSSEKFDLIVSNPPYYLPGHGQPYRDKRRELARSFVVDNWIVLLDCIRDSLSPGGKAYLVVKNDQKILAQIKHQFLNIDFENEGDLVFVTLTVKKWT